MSIMLLMKRCLNLQHIYRVRKLHTTYHCINIQSLCKMICSKADIEQVGNREVCISLLFFFIFYCDIKRYLILTLLKRSHK